MPQRYHYIKHNMLSRECYKLLQWVEWEWLFGTNATVGTLGSGPTGPKGQSPRAKRPESLLYTMKCAVGGTASIFFQYFFDSRLQ